MRISDWSSDVCSSDLIVSRYAQKCYLDFMDRLDARGGFIPDGQYYREAIARAIMLRQTERIVSRQKFGGHRAEIVTYTLAWLAHHPALRVALDAIWAQQSMSDSISEERRFGTECVSTCRSRW